MSLLLGGVLGNFYGFLIIHAGFRLTVVQLWDVRHLDTLKNAHHISHSNKSGVKEDMKINHIPITQEQFDTICSLTAWTIEELDLKTLKLIPKIVRPDQVFGGYISGALEQPKMLNGHVSIAGLDVFVHEPYPQTLKHEGDVNVYHYVIQRTGRTDFPYILHGPFRDETLLGHWPTGLVLDVYENRDA